MTVDLVNLGSGPNAQDADSIRDSFGKVNNNSVNFDRRIRQLERVAHPYGAYEDPGFPPFPAFNYATQDWEKATSVARIHAVDGLDNSNLAGFARVFAMSDTRFLLVTVTASIVHVKIFELTESGIEEVAEDTVNSTTSNLLSVAIISESFAKIFITRSSSIFSVEVNYSDGILTVSAPIASTPSSIISSSISASNNTRAALLNNSSSLSFCRSGSTASNQLIALRHQTGQGLTRHLDTALDMSFSGTATSNPSYDYLSNERFIIAHVSSTIDSSDAKLGISVVEADDNQVKLLGITHFTSEVSGGISVFALSPSLAIVSWQAGGVYRAIAVGINADSQPYLLGPATSSGASSTLLVCGTPESPTSLLVGSWPKSGESGKLAKLEVDTETGVISEVASIDYDISWAAGEAKWVDMIRLSDNRVLAVVQPTVAPYGIVLDVLELEPHE